MSPDQTAPKGGHIYCNIGYQSTLVEEIASNNCSKWLKKKLDILRKWKMYLY